MKEKFINKIVVGESVNDCFILKSISPDKNGDYAIVLADKTGEVSGLLPKSCFSNGMESLKGCAVDIVGIVTNQGKNPFVKCRSISAATNYKLSELLNGLPDEKIQEYKTIIRAVQGCIRNPHYKMLVDHCLTDEVLEKLAKFPASLNSYGKYAGGALASCAIVSDMAVHMGQIYVQLGNGIYSKDFQWSLLLTAALLHTYGNLKFIVPDAPFKKTDIGNSMGLLAVMQLSIQEMCNAKQIPLSEAEFADLINTLNASILATSNIKAVNKEGIMLRHIISLYNECDVFDCEVAASDFSGTNTTWSGKLGRVIQAVPLSRLDNEKEGGSDV